MELAACDWNAPGADRYTGTVAAAIHAYVDIPKPVRDVLVARTNARQFDDHVTITRHGIVGKHDYAPALYSMHFGSKGKVCRTVSRAKWTDSAVERGLVYCEQGHCIVIPSVCGNVARVTRLSKSLAPTGTAPVEQTAQSVLAPQPGTLAHSTAAPETFAQGVTSAAPTVLGSTPATGGAAGVALGGPAFGAVTYPSHGPIFNGNDVPVAFPTEVAPVAPIPEPSTYALLAAGLAGLRLYNRRRKK